MEAETEGRRTAFEQAVHDVLRSLEPSDVVTYGEVAVEAGYSKRASRSVGGYLVCADRSPRSRGNVLSPGCA